MEISMEPQIWEPVIPLSSLFQDMEGYEVEACPGHGFWFCHVGLQDGLASLTTSTEWGGGHFSRFMSISGPL